MSAAGFGQGEQSFDGEEEDEDNENITTGQGFYVCLLKVERCCSLGGMFEHVQAQVCGNLRGARCGDH